MRPPASGATSQTTSTTPSSSWAAVARVSRAANDSSCRPGRLPTPTWARAAQPTTTSPSSHGPAKGTPAAQTVEHGPARASASLLLLQGEGGGGRLEELRPAPPLRLREGEDPLPPHHGHLPPPPEAGRGCGEARAGDGTAAVCVSVGTFRRWLHEGRPPRRRREARPARRGGGGRARLRSQLPAAA